MNVDIITVGKLKEDYLKAACAEYEKRLSAFCKLSVIELAECRLPDEPSPKETENALKTEGEAISKKMSGGAYNIAMCIEGREMTSEELASAIASAAAAGKSRFNFIIGSSCGLAPGIKAAADLRLSMSRMTFPHQLARVILLEQIYRCFMINNGKKYHK